MPDDKMRTQRIEFDAVRDLARAYNNLPPIVDDDYPRIRNHYERAVRILIEAFKSNGRIS